MFNNKNKIIFLSLVFIGLLFSFSVVFAAEPTKLTYEFPCSGLPGTTCPSSEEAAQSPAAYIARFYQFALMLAGMLAFGMIIFGAIQYIISAGSPAAQSDARDRIFQALWGVALLFGAYLILYTIDPKLVSLTDPNINFITNTETPATASTATSTTYPFPLPLASATAPTLTPSPNPSISISPTPVTLPPTTNLNLPIGNLPTFTPWVPTQMPMGL